MRLLPVYEHPKLSKDNLWATIQSNVVELLDQQKILLTSIDLFLFSWVEENDDVEEDQDVEQDNTKVAPSGTVIITPVTTWVGVFPNTLTGEVAFHSSNTILNLLKEHGIYDVEVAYRESVARVF
ncbi:hypothetical protein NEOLEDRAFT_1131288 [Neolentinus lepideus HHB14362 ss-1]|uniref:Uncharacterized protein n=1 Tax=Neolentinus lepideus HHB14362 ss-1 TaxID=1314782 RepID=A0A165TVM0_9AGAM|nr:hypothetical protein NEOLEDRAFT_1131288 [Neolentinus lepideus HHB14362 ss-1]